MSRDTGRRGRRHRPTTDAGDDAKASNKVLLGVDELYAGIPGDGPLELVEVEHWFADPKNNEVLDFELPLGLVSRQRTRWSASTRTRSPGRRSNWVASFTSIRDSSAGRHGQLCLVSHSRRGFCQAHAVWRRH